MICLLLNLAAGQGPGKDGGITLRSRVSQQALGQLVGSSRESVNKQLQVWRKAGWLDVEKGRITIRQAAHLEKAARTA